MSFADYTNARLNGGSNKSKTFTEYTKERLNLDDYDISPVVIKVGNSKNKNTSKKKEEDKWYDGWFKKSEGNASDALKGTGADLLTQFMTGIAGMGETTLDSLAYLRAPSYNAWEMQNGGFLTPEDHKVADIIRKESEEFIKKDLYNEKEVAKNIVAGTGSLFTGKSQNEMKKYLNEDMERYSVMDEKARGVVQSGGQLAVTALMSPVVPWYVTTGMTSFGGELDNALNQGATFEQAGQSALITAGAEILSEKLSGGISFGGKTLDAGAVDLLSKKIAPKGLRALSKFGLDAAGEGGEEIVSEFFSKLGSSLYKEEDLDEILFSEQAMDDYITSFISGGALGGFSSGKNIVKDTVKGNDVLTGYSKNEQTVFNKVLENRVQAEEKKTGKKLTSKEKSKVYDEVRNSFERGEIEIDEIENILGGETLSKYNSLVEQEDSLTKRLKELGSAPNTVENAKQYDSIESQLNELKSKNEKAQLKSQLSREVFDMTKSDARIQESYAQREKRKHDFTADLSKYNAKSRETIQRAIDSGILNDTRKTHEFVDLVAKLSAEKGVSFDFLNNKKLRESGFVLEGKTINGFKRGNDIVINMESKKALNTVVGHEITHVLEGSPELYSALSESAKEFGEAKGVYKEMYDAAFENYKDVYKNMSEEEYAKAIEQEVTSDLIAEYVFSDIDFIRGLSSKNRNVFQKVYDEIKYFIKSVKAGSDGEKKLLKVKKMFEEVYRESVNTETESKVQFGLVGKEDGIEVYETSEDTKKLSYSERKAKLLDAMIKEFSGRTAKFTKNGESYYALYDKAGVKKGVHGDKKSDKKGYKAKINIGADGNYIELAENALYTRSSIEQGKDNAFHKDAKSWDYYVKTIKSDGNYFDVLINVKDNGDNHYVYDVTLKEATSLPDQLRSYDGNSIASEKSITQNSEKVNDDIKFSISDSVETGRELVAVHNLTSDKLLKTLDLGAFPMPSIAVTKSSLGHSNFGDISFVFSKDTINPSNKKNKVYAADAWTPTFPRVEYEVDTKRVREIRDSFKPLLEKLPERIRHNPDSFISALEYNLDNYGGYEGVVERALSDESMKQAYLAQTDDVVEDIMTENKTTMSEAEISISKNIIESLGEDTILDVAKKSGREIYNNHGEQIREALVKTYDELGLDADVVQEVIERMKPLEIVKFIRTTRDYINTGGVKVETKIDYGAISNEINSRIDNEKYKQWLKDTFSGIEKSKGISNGKEIFTPSGNRRSFSQTHYPVTADNIVKSMLAQSDDVRNVAGFNGIKSIRAVAVKEFKNIEDIRKSGEKLKDIDTSEFEAMNEELTKRLHNVMGEILDSSKRESYNRFIDMDNIGLVILDACKKPTIANIKKTFDETVWKVTDEQAKEIKSIVDDVINMPVNMFEAKPLRSVGFDEVEAVLVPSDIDSKLREELTNRGLNIVEYEAGNETDRATKLNELDDLKFSISNSGQSIAPSRNGYYSNDLLLGNLVQESPDLVQDEVIDAPVQQNAFADDYAPLTETEANIRDDRQIDEHYFPDDIPVETEREEGYNGNYADHITPSDPFYEKDIFEVGKDRKQKAYMYENPEVKPYFQQEARYMLGELNNSTKGERLYNDKLYYDTNGEQGFFGTKRHTSEEIAYLLDTFGYTYKDIAKGLNAIIEDNGKENNAISKRIEFLLDERLRLGYKDFVFGDNVPPNQEYINLLNEKQINEYNDEAFGNWVQNLSEDDINYFTQRNEEIAPVSNEYMPVETEDVQTENALEESFDAPVAEPVERIGDELTRKNAEKIRNIQARIEGFNLTKDVTVKEFREKIAKKEAEYDALANKSTKKAADILNQINNLKSRRDSILADMDRRIDNHNRAIDNIEKRSRFEKRSTKQQELRTWARDLIGNTATWVDKKIGLQYQTNTLKRNLRDIVRDESGNKDIARADRIYDELQGTYNVHEAELNRETNAIKKVFMDMNITKAENTYIQMLGELRHNPATKLTEDVVNEFYEKNKSKIDTAKVDKAIEESRKLYDGLYERVNEALREHGFKEIDYRKGYFPHFVEEKQSMLAKLFNWKTQNNDIPTDIAGLTEEFNPQRSWQTFDKHRKSDVTDYNFAKGLDSYVQGALDWIYHIEDIQKRRAIEQEIRYRHSEAGVQKEVDNIRNNPFLTAEEAEMMIDEVFKEAKNPLGNFLIDFRNGTNNLAGKKSTADRSMEYATNRHIYSVMTNLSSRVSANMVAGSVSSAMTNFIPITQSWGEVSPVSSLVAMQETIKSTIRDDGTIQKSPFLTNRLAKAEMLYKTKWDKVGEGVSAMMNIVDGFTSQVVWRSKYNENIKNGMSENEAVKNADNFAEGVMAGRSRGNMPTIFNSKNPVTKMLTAFQLEVANQYGYMFKDMPQNAKNENVGKLVKGYATMFVGAWAYNALTSSLTGRDSAFDPIGILQEFIGDLGDDEEEPLDALAGLGKNIAEDTPFIGGLMGGGRVPIASAIPYDNPVDMVTGSVEDIAEKDWKSLADEWSNPLYYMALPMGGGQLRKTVQGLSMFDDDLPVSGSYTKSGDLRFPVEDTFLNKLQAGVFGQYANENAREYFDRGLAPMDEKQIQEYTDLELPISEYWDYTEGLKEQEKVKDKFEYINDLDVPVDKKNIMINNAVTRKEPIDMSNYNDFSGYEEFDWYTKNTEKYDYFKEYGVSWSEYMEADDDTKDTIDGDYSVYKNYPEKVTLSKALNDNWIEYRSWYKDLNAIRADKDEYGNSISGTAKAKKMAYIESLPLKAEQKMILHRICYDGKKDKNTYNPQIIKYLESRSDISYEERVTILEELGMKVSLDGTITW